LIVQHAIGQQLAIGSGCVITGLPTTASASTKATHANLRVLISFIVCSPPLT
jgi:hypothetical protein